MRIGLSFTRRIIPSILCLLCIGLLMSHYAWVLYDQDLPYLGYYASRALTLFDTIALTGFEDFLIKASRAAGGPRSPLYQVFSLPFIAVFGRSADSILIMNGALHCLAVVGCFFIGRTLCGELAGICSAFLVAINPQLSKEAECNLGRSTGDKLL